MSTLLGERNGETDENTSTRNRKEYGTHSIRKGLAIFASSDTTSGPSIVPICMRCGWSIGVVMECNIRHEAAGDQSTDRVVVGLPVISVNVSVLPRHFDNSQDAKLQKHVPISV